MSFQEHLTPATLADLIIRDKRFKYNYIIVEGETDKKLFSKFISGENRIRIALGVEKVIEVISILNIRKTTNNNFFGIIDADFRNVIDESELLPENILTTDTHDLETLILNSPAFQYVYKELGSKQKIAKFEEETGLSLIENLLELAKPIAYLKIVNLKQKIGLKFKPKKLNKKGNNDLKFDKFIQKSNLKFKGNIQLINTVKAFLDNSQLLLNNIEKELESEMKNSYNLWQICNGHDIVKIFCLGLRQKLGSSQKNIKELENEVERLLRASYDSSYFKETKLFKKILKWQKLNSTAVLSSTFEN